MFFTAITCPANMVYSECAPGCPKICKNLDMKCSTKCIPGCTCPDGKYHDGENASTGIIARATTVKNVMFTEILVTNLAKHGE